MASLRSADIDNIRIGDSASCRLTVTEQQINSFADFSHDTNALHMDDDFARQRGYSSRVAHGMLALSAISQLIGTQLPGPGSLWISQESEFVTPVFPGDNLEARVTVLKYSRAAQLVLLCTDVIHTDSNVVVLRGTAKVRIPR